MKIINGVVYLEPGETLGASKKIKRMDSTRQNFWPGCVWSKKVDQMRNHGRYNKRR